MALHSVARQWVATDAAMARLHCQRKRWTFTSKSRARGVVVVAVTMRDPARALADTEKELIPKRRGWPLSSKSILTGEVVAGITMGNL